MKQKTFNLICLLLAFISGVLTFALKYHVLAKEKSLRQIYSEITHNKREMHGLQTDWASLTNPEFLRKQAGQRQAKPLQAKQIVQVEQLQERLLPPPKKRPNFERDE